MLVYPKWFNPREYQLKAINNWVNNKYMGLLEMATGSGKTTTSFIAINEVFSVEDKCVVIILCPFTHLVEQWSENIEQFGINALLCYGNKNDWITEFDEVITNNSKLNKIQKVLIFTNVSFLNEYVQERIKEVETKFLIIDEAHYAGSNQLSEVLTNDYKYRLGLSATPTRYFDEEGTEKLMSFFRGTVYKYTLGEAIRDGFLTPYKYYPIKVYMTNKEYSEYEKLTNMAASMMNNTEFKMSYQQILIKRNKIIQNAENKLNVFKEVIESFRDKKHLLVYCGSGSNDNKKQIDLVTNILGNELSMKVGRYTFSETQRTKTKLLDFYKSGDIYQAIVAIKCLDEGIDIPPIRTAFILASTNNPKEFVQRRGRLLRKSENKEFSEIYDFFIVPPKIKTLFKGDKNTKSIIETEFRRLKEYYSEALNNNEFENVRNEIYNEFNLEESYE